jgi:hypothetical protein
MLKFKIKSTFENSRFISTGQMSTLEQHPLEKYFDGEN